MAKCGHKTNRSKIAWLAGALLLSGCSSTGNVTYRDYVTIVRQAFKSTFTRNDVQRATAAAVPYASMGYRINNGDENMLVLATDTGDNQLWTAATHVVFQTSGGRILRTVGLPHDLGGTASQRGQNLTPPVAALQKPFTSARLSDFPDINAYGVAITCNAVARRPENVRILGQTIATIRVDEACQNNGLTWRFVDSFWLDSKTGFAWRSLQHISPAGETVETEIFRPPG